MEINEKLEIFLEAVIDAANKQSGEILNEQKKAYQDTLVEYEKGKQDGMLARKRISEAKIRKEINRAISEQEILLKKQYHQKEEEKTEELFSMVRQKLIEYQKTDEYEQLLVQKILRAKEFAAGEEMTVYIDPADSQRRETLEQKTGCAVTVGREQFMGGIRAVIRSKNVLIDESFAGKLAQERKLYSF